MGGPLGIGVEMDAEVRELVKSARRMIRQMGCPSHGLGCSQGPNCPTMKLYNAVKRVEEKPKYIHLIQYLSMMPSATCRRDIRVDDKNTTGDLFEVTCGGCRRTPIFARFMIKLMEPISK